MISKYQEKTFKKFVRNIEDLTADYRTLLEESYNRGKDFSREIREKNHEIIKVRVSFFKFFKNNCKKKI